MDIVISKLEQWDHELAECLKYEADPELASAREEINRALLLLQKIQKVSLKGTPEQVLALPLEAHTNSSYRILDDYNSEHVSDWLEFELRGEPVQMKAGDLLVRMKQATEQ